MKQTQTYKKPDLLLVLVIAMSTFVFGYAIGVSIENQSLFINKTVKIDRTIQDTTKEDITTKTPNNNNEIAGERAEVPEQVDTNQVDGNGLKTLENACSDLQGYLGCNALTCADGSCACVEEQECEECEVCENQGGGGTDNGDNSDPEYFNDAPPAGINDALKFLENKNIFNDPIGYGCNDHGDNRDHLFNALRINMAGDTLFTSEYFGGSAFALDDTHMDLAADKSLDFRGTCTYGYASNGGNFFENPAYPCEVGSFYFSTGGDCGGARIRGGYTYGNDLFVLYPGTYLHQDPFTILKGTGRTLSVVADIRASSGRTYGTPPEGINNPRANGGFSLVGAGISGHNGKLIQFFVGINGKKYGIVEDMNQADPKRYYIYNYSDMGNPLLVDEVDSESKLYELLTMQSNPFRSSPFHGNSSVLEPYFIVVNVHETTLDLYDITNPVDMEELGTVPNNGIYSRGGYATSRNVYRVHDTIYLLADDGTLYKYVIGQDTEFGRVYDTGLPARYGFDQNMKITKDHVMFLKKTANNEDKLTVVNLRTGTTLMNNITIPDSYADRGNRTVKLNMRDWVVARHGENYYLYGIRSQTIEGGPNYIQALKIGTVGSGTFVDNTCRPQCTQAYMCGVNDGCGNYCFDGYANGDTLDACSQEYFECTTTHAQNRIHGLDNSQPSCMCGLREPDYCSPGSTTCEWKERGSGGWGLCPTYSDGPVDVDVYTCEGNTSACSTIMKRREIRCYLSQVANCTYIGSNSADDPWGNGGCGWQGCD